MHKKTKAKIKEKFAQHTYPINIIARNNSISEAMKTYAMNKLKKIEKFGAHIMEAHIVMNIEKFTHIVNFLISMNHSMVKVTGSSDDMYRSIDQAIDKLKAKIRKYIHHLRQHNTHKPSTVDVNVQIVERHQFTEEINDQIEEENLQNIEKTLHPHRIVDKETMPLKTLNQEEAIMKMELSEDLFLIYRAEEDNKLKVIYRRKDANYGIIEAQ